MEAVVQAIGQNAGGLTRKQALDAVAYATAWWLAHEITGSKMPEDRAADVVADFRARLDSALSHALKARRA
jgi:hypothetical protein